MPTPREVLLVGYPGAELLDIACVSSALGIADAIMGRSAYRVRIAAIGGAPIRTWTGVTVEADVGLERVTGPIDTVIVSGGLGYVDALDDQNLVAHIRRLSRDARRVASICTGAGLLAAAGMLDGKRAATHWDHAAYLSARFPAVTFDSGPIYLIDGDVATSAGVTTALDLTLAFIEDDLGADVARLVARQAVTYLQRPGNQAQMSMFTAAPAPRNPLVQNAVAHISAQLGTDLSTGSLAARAGVSDRHLTRLFLRDLGVSPGRFVRRARTEACAQLLTSSELTMDTIADRCGFGTPETMRQAFHDHYGVSPSHYRATQSATGRADHRLATQPVS